MTSCHRCGPGLSGSCEQPGSASPNRAYCLSFVLEPVFLALSLHAAWPPALRFLPSAGDTVQARCSRTLSICPQQNSVNHPFSCLRANTYHLSSQLLPDSRADFPPPRSAPFYHPVNHGTRPAFTGIASSPARMALNDRFVQSFRSRRLTHWPTDLHSASAPSVSV